MHYTIETVRDHLRVEVYGRETAEETREYLKAVSAKVLESGVPRVLVWMRNCRPIFKVEKYRISQFLKVAAANADLRVAFLADSEELRASHEYVELLARQQGAKIRAFRDEAAALQWLRAETVQSQEKR